MNDLYNASSEAGSQYNIKNGNKRSGSNNMMSPPATGRGKTNFNNT